MVSPLAWGPFLSRAPRKSAILTCIMVVVTTEVNAFKHWKKSGSKQVEFSRVHQVWVRSAGTAAEWGIQRTVWILMGPQIITLILSIKSRQTRSVLIDKHLQSIFGEKRQDQTWALITLTGQWGTGWGQCVGSRSTLECGLLNKAGSLKNGEWMKWTKM